MRNKHDLEFDGQHLSEFGAVLSETPHYTIAIKDIEFTSLPGKAAILLPTTADIKTSRLHIK